MENQRQVLMVSGKGDPKRAPHAPADGMISRDPLRGAQPLALTCGAPRGQAGIPFAALCRSPPPVEEGMDATLHERSIRVQSRSRSRARLFAYTK